MSNYDEWRKRKEGLDNLVTTINKENVFVEGPPQAHLVGLVNCLSSFTTELFDFFLNGFSDFLGSSSTQTIKLIPSAEYPPEYVLQKILQQASFDLTVIERAIEQRKNKELGDLLENYDQLALSALSIAFPKQDQKETWLIDPVKPFVYFQRETSVRIIPYANALLIGVPYSAIHQPIDLLSIPHEIGHHVYETGRFSEMEPIDLYFEKYFADQPEWIQNWLEEIFADLYGFLVAGPIVGFSLQEILLDNFPGDLCQDDGDHPAGIVRPLIYSRLFNSRQSDKAKATASKLDENWLKEGRRRGFAKKFKPFTENNVIDRDEAYKIISPVMHKMYIEINLKTKNAFTFPTENEADVSKLSPWTLFSKIDLDNPFSEFNEIAKSLGKSHAGNMETLYTNPGFELSRKDKYKYWLADQIAHWNDKKAPPLPPNIWKLIFTAFNWADQPDDTRPVHGPENIRY
jgi:hypothetical protein